MDGRCVFFACILCGILLANEVHTLNEESNDPAVAEIVITENGSMKKIEVRNSSNKTSTLPGSPAIHQGNNVYIKPKFIIGSPFTSYKQGINDGGSCCDDIRAISKISDRDTSILIRSPPTPKLPTVVIPPVISPDTMSITPPRFPFQPQMPIAFPHPCLPIPFPLLDNQINITMRCPVYVPNVARVPKFPILVEKPLVIPKPPVLPPITLPKFPVQVIIQKPIFTRLPNLVAIPNQSFVVPSMCPPRAKCVPVDKNIASGSDILTVIFEKFKNLLSTTSRIDLSQIFELDEEVSKTDFPPAFPTLCAHGIIAERIVPNIVRSDDKTRVLMSPVFPSQFTHSDFYRK